MELGDFVPLLTAVTGLSELHLRGAGIDVLESVRHASRKIALVTVLQQDANGKANAANERGIYITPKSVNVQEQDAAVLLCTLRHVDLQREPFWGSLLVLLSSHLFVASNGAISTQSFFPSLCFLPHYLKWQITEGNTTDDVQNTMHLKELMPKFTWVALDLKIKDMEGIETPTKYFENKLTNPPLHGGASDQEMETQILAAELLPSAARDCLNIKSTTLLTPPEYGSPQAFTSPKILSHALDAVAPKALFGRYLSGGVLLHLLRSLAHSISNSSQQSSIVLQRIVQNVQLSYWKLLLESAYEKYSDEIHARLSVYEKVEFNAAYLVDITERKLQSSEIVSVVNAGQGQFSSFDEFGNLKRAPAQEGGSGSSSNNLLKGGAPEGAHGDQRPTLNTGIFSFIKNRAERAFSKQFSGLTSSSSNASSSSATASLNHIPEDDATADGDYDDDIAPVSLQTPEDLLLQYNHKIKDYQVPMRYIHTPIESMPVSATTLDEIHRIALKEAHQLILPFIYDLRCTDARFSEFNASVVDISIGKRNLSRKIQQLKNTFQVCNEAASTMFCSQLIQYLHAIVLKKNDRDNAAQQKTLPRLGRSTSSVMLPDSSDTNAAPLTKLPLELLTYKNNLEALVSQYNFVARGPRASRVLIGFYQAVICKRLLALAQKEYNRFADACDIKETKLADLEDSFEDTQQLVQRHQKANQAFDLQEAKAIAQIEQKNKHVIVDLEESIRDTTSRIEKALRDQQNLYQTTMQATRTTINTIDAVSTKNRVFHGYLERFEKGHMFSKSWRQYYYVLDHSTLKCYKSKSAFEERGPPCEPPISLIGYNVIKSRTDEMKIKVVPPEAGQMLRFRAPASVGRETWMKKLIEAAQVTGNTSGKAPNRR